MPKVALFLYEDRFDPNLDYVTVHLAEVPVKGGYVLDDSREELQMYRVEMVIFPIRLSEAAAADDPVQVLAVQVDMQREYSQQLSSNPPD